MTEKFSYESTIDVTADSVVRATRLPEIAGLSPTYFVALRVSDASGNTVGENFYWLSTKPEAIDWEKSTWYTTPTTFLCRLHGAGAATESQTKRFGTQREERRKRNHARNLGESHEKLGVLCAP